MMSTPDRAIGDCDINPTREADRRPVRRFRTSAGRGIRRSCGCAANDRCPGWSTSMGRCGSCLRVSARTAQETARSVRHGSRCRPRHPVYRGRLDDASSPSQERRRRRRSDLLPGQRERIRGKDKIISRPTRLPTWRSRPSTATTPTRRSRSIAGSRCPRSGSATKPSWSSWSFSRMGDMPSRRPARPSRSSRRPRCTTGCSRPQTVSDTEWIKELRSWVRRTLKPRVRRSRREDAAEIEIQQPCSEIVRVE